MGGRIGLGFTCPSSRLPCLRLLLAYFAMAIGLGLAGCHDKSAVNSAGDVTAAASQPSADATIAKDAAVAGTDSTADVLPADAAAEIDALDVQPESDEIDVAADASDATLVTEADASAPPCVTDSDCSAGPCTSASCAAGVCEPGPPQSCADGNPCTDDGCDPASGCTHLANAATCSDGDACTGGDHCGGGTCLPGAATGCDDGNACTDDACDKTSGCKHLANTVTCTDDDVCSNGDVCQGGTCALGEPLYCSDGNPCTKDTCDKLNGCNHIANSDPCSDGKICTSNDKCSGGACQPGGPTVCDDGNACTSDACAAPKGCVHASLSGSCTALGPCAKVQVCQDGVCTGNQWLPCDDGNPCTADLCDPTWGCYFKPASGPCDDGNACSVGETCQVFECKATAALACSDGDPCTTDTCNPQSGCVFVAGALACDDKNPCTTDSCGAQGCVNLPGAGTCTDGDACTAGDSCASGKCQAGGQLLCNDNEVCSFDACSPSQGCVFTPIVSPCSDGSPCTVGDKCSQGKCKPGTFVNCDDGKACTADACNGAGDCLHQLFTGPCGSGGTCLADGSCCKPTCDGKACGSDGCGGTCGSCQSGSACSAAGQCAATSCGSVAAFGCCNGAWAETCTDKQPASENCASFGKTCGWLATSGTYGCGGQGADPSGIHPLACQAACVANATQACCGLNLCWYDSCGNLGTVAQTCGFGCDSKAKACQSDSCQGVSSAGVCLADGKTIAACVTTTGQGGGYLAYSVCGGGTTCQMQAGKAVCQLQAGTCTPQSSECDPASPDSMRTCNATGKWVSQPCPGCKASTQGPICLGDVTTVPFTVLFTYEFRTTNASLTDWNGQVSTAALAGVLAYVRRTNPDGTSLWLDVGTTDESGSVTLKLPKQPQPGDALVVALAQLAPDGTVQFGVAAPDVGTGLKEVTAVEYGDHVLWNWALPASQLGASGQTFNISIANSSGAARLFHHLRKIVNQAKVSFGKSGLSLVLWANPGTSWTCGACFWDGFVAQVGAAKFASQIWLSWTTQDQEVWADSVVAHEIGHWVMRSYGTSPGEGGKHYVGVPTFPGQAWSEGWATWFSSAARGSTLYADKQSGLFFWFDIGQKAYYDGKTFPPASASGGILQNMDENLVSATLWQMTTKVGGELPFASAANAPFWKALTTPRMNVAPYARGYTQHTWQTSYPGQFTNVYDTGKPAPMLADFLDALACGLMDASKIQPAVANYPYSAAQPKCNVGGVP